MRDLGIDDPAAFFDWAEATHPTQTKRRHMAGRLDGYRQLARRYMDAKGMRGATTDVRALEVGRAQTLAPWSVEVGARTGYLARCEGSVPYGGVD
jgi:hypothetical protein